MKSITLVTSCFAVAAALAPGHGLLHRSKRLEPRQTARRTYAPHYFAQKIDHFPNATQYEPHTDATFTQRYFFDNSYYKPGGPVYLYIGGETSGENRFSNLDTGIIQILMEATNGLGVILENRYYGKSFPFNTSTTDELRFLTTEQTIADNAYFAQHATFPGVNATLTAPSTPWILYGGSLAGAQTAFSLKVYGGDSGILWGGIASSGTTKAKLTYPEWYQPIQKYGPQDCIGSLHAIIDDIDAIFATQNRTLITQMKDIFGLADLDDRDFAMTIAFPLGGPMNYPTNTWQELNWNPSYNSDDFFLFCSNVTSPASPSSLAIDTALTPYTHHPTPNLGNYATYIRTYLLPLCPSPSLLNTTTCFSTQNATFYALPTNSASRSYLYSTCTESGLYQAAPETGPSLLSRVLDASYTQQWCTWAFPSGSHSSIPSAPDTETYNRYGGYDVLADRLARVDGDQDVWNQICYHTDERAARQTLDSQEAYRNPQLLITGAGHHWDSYGIRDVDAEPLFIREAHRWEIRIVRAWLEEWKQKYGNVTM
ncbi:cell division control protein 42 [Sphaceloma murrayae]|uniref:Cell division control protein 42 n=1 Tax=Sphaceloma murrayae TaxID=2082308 RepID=A0A2K1QJE9_9PEZI|nr:cell division control protein 42 [Sphaceloma murrayae]